MKRLAVALMLSIALLPLAAVAETRIKSADVVVPEGVTLGQYQRTTRPFENWTVICDENLEKREKVCNITQTIEDEAGTLVFSWSLAATVEGNPFMILRTAPNAAADGLIALEFEGRSSPVKVHIDGCNASVCVGMVPVGPIMREQISRSAISKISYDTSNGQTVAITATLAGLSQALETLE